MKDFRDLAVWQKAHGIVPRIYRATAVFPTEERYGLTSQIRRAAISIPTNIAEGCGRIGDRELRHFLNIAMGSASELQYLLMVAKELDFFSQGQVATLEADIEEVKRMLSGFIKKLMAES